MKKFLTLATLLTFATLASYAQKHVDIYRSGTFFKSYSTIDSAIKAANTTGDSLVLSAHTFYETLLDARTKDIHYQGTITTTDTTTIDGSGKKEYLLYSGANGSVRDIIFQNAKLDALRLRSVFVLTDTFRIGGNSTFRNIDSFYVVYGSPNFVIIEDNVKIINNHGFGVIKLGQGMLKDNVLIAHNHAKVDLANSQDGLIHFISNAYIIGNVKIINNTSDSMLTSAILISHEPGRPASYIGDSVTISGNRSITPGFETKGGAVYIAIRESAVSPVGPRTFTVGAANFENNEATKGGAIYCEDSSFKIVLNGTRFSGNKAKYGGAIYTKGSVDIKNANFENNQADSGGTAIYVNSAMGGSGFLSVGVSNSRFYNSTRAANKQDHIFATYYPSTAIPPTISLNGNWWGKSDTFGVLRESPKGLTYLYNWAKANWSIKGGTPVVSGDTSFPVAAKIEYSSGASVFPMGSFPALKGIFTTDTGTFTPSISPINSSNIVSSTFKTYKDSALTSVSAHFVASIDADTFRKTQIIWSKDTLVKTGSKINYKTLPEITLYPNPVKDVLHFEGMLSSSKIRVYDLQGKVVASSDIPNDMYLGHLPLGTYIVEIRQPDGSVGTAKVQKE